MWVNKWVSLLKVFLISFIKKIFFKEYFNKSLNKTV